MAVEARYSLPPLPELFRMFENISSQKELDAVKSALIKHVEDLASQKEQELLAYQRDMDRVGSDCTRQNLQTPLASSAQKRAATISGSSTSEASQVSDANSRLEDDDISMVDSECSEKHRTPLPHAFTQDGVLVLHLTVRDLQNFPDILEEAKRLGATKDGFFKIRFPPSEACELSHEEWQAIVDRLQSEPTAELSRYRVIRNTRAYSKIQREVFNGSREFPASPPDYISDEDSWSMFEEKLKRRDGLDDCRYYTDLDLEEPSIQKALGKLPVHLLPTKGDQLETTLAKIRGLHSIFVYVGSNSPFTLHLDEIRTIAVNCCLFGEKYWLFTLKAELEAALKQLDRHAYKYACDMFAKHESGWVFREWLREHNIPFKTHTQRAGELIVVLSETYHQGFSGPGALNIARGYAERLDFSDYVPCEADHPDNLVQPSDLEAIDSPRESDTESDLEAIGSPDARNHSADINKPKGKPKRKDKPKGKRKPKGKPKPKDKPKVKSQSKLNNNISKQPSENSEQSSDTLIQMFHALGSPIAFTNIFRVFNAKQSKVILSLDYPAAAIYGLAESGDYIHKRCIDLRLRQLYEGLYDECSREQSCGNRSGQSVRDRMMEKMTLLCFPNESTDVFRERKRWIKWRLTRSRHFHELNRAYPGMMYLWHSAEVAESAFHRMSDQDFEDLLSKWRESRHEELKKISEEFAQHISATLSLDGSQDYTLTGDESRLENLPDNASPLQSLNASGIRCQQIGRATQTGPEVEHTSFLADMDAETLPPAPFSLQDVLAQDLAGATTREPGEYAHRNADTLWDRNADLQMTNDMTSFNNGAELNLDALMDAMYGDQDEFLAG